MKETRYFYAPDAPQVCELHDDEANHCTRVLRLTEGEEINLTNGKGYFYKARITTATQKRCLFEIIAETHTPKTWSGKLHLAVAPTKNMERIEWLAEKATEIGFDELTFLHCRFSERKVVKTERIDKILISAMKQSQKSIKPQLNEIEHFEDFVAKPFTGEKCIAHCYAECDVKNEGGEKPFLFDLLDTTSNTLVLIGPEGDFSIEEVKLAIKHGFRPITLGTSRMRTETAALVAVHLMNLKKRY